MAFNKFFSEVNRQCFKFHMFEPLTVALVRSKAKMERVGMETNQVDLKLSSVTGVRMFQHLELAGSLLIHQNGQWLITITAYILSSTSI